MFFIPSIQNLSQGNIALTKSFFVERRAHAMLNTILEQKVKTKEIVNAYITAPPFYSYSQAQNDLVLSTYSVNRCKLSRV